MLAPRQISARQMQVVAQRHQFFSTNSMPRLSHSQSLKLKRNLVPVIGYSIGKSYYKKGCGNSCEHRARDGIICEYFFTIKIIPGVLMSREAILGY